ncbi:MAG: FAD-dependent oxidoreductase [Coriobacteriia bacterium]
MEKSAAVLSRRELIKGAVALAALGALSGCSGSGKEGDSTQNVKADQTLTADVVVVGSGIAGLPAAIEAAQKGAKVILLEKENQLGGNTNVAEGVFGVGSSLQKKLGITVTADQILAQEFAFHNYNVNPKLWEEIAANGGPNIDWLIDLGVEFETVTSPAAGEKTWHVYMHGEGKTAIEVLEPVAEKAGVEIMKSTSGTSLLMENGAVAGIRATGKGDSIIDIKAKAVILATGGMGSSTEELLKRTNLESGRFTYWGMPGCSGDGIRMAEEAGMGREPHITVCNLGMNVPGLGLPNHFGTCIGMEPTNLWVNQDAVRFLPESYVFYQTGAANAVLNQIKTFSIMDQAAVDRLFSVGPILGLGAIVRAGQPATKIKTDLEKALSNKNENVFTANTIEDLAKAMGVDAQTLSATVKEYNGYCDAGADAQYKKAPEFLDKLDTPPFYAARLTANTLNTLGGVRVNLDMEVIKADGTPIPGLYAAGMECSGYAGETYGLIIPGSTQGIALGTGRIAGDSAAAYVKG